MSRFSNTGPMLAAAAIMFAPFVSPTRVLAEPPAAPASDTATASQIVTEARRILAERYVLPETAVALDRALAAAERAGRFKELAGPALADAVNAVMQTVTPDGHLGMRYDPRQAAMLAERPRGPRDAKDAALPPAVARMIALNNAGVRKLEVLPGNVRYMDYTGFAWGTPDAEAALDNAARFLAGGSAIVIDLRRNGGGSAEAVAALTSYFLPAGTPLMHFRERGRAEEITRTRPAALSLAARPVYVLMSPATFSAAEEFAAHVSAFGFATLVGEPTRGGGFNNSFEPLPGGHVLSVSIATAIHAKTGKSWEKTGIAPAIAVPADRALATAQAEAVAALGKTATGGEAEAYAQLLPVLRAQADGTTAALPLAAYTGRFGERTLAIGADGRLTSQRDGGPLAVLVPLGGHAFAPEAAPAQRFTFTADSDRATALEVTGPGGTQSTPRS